MVGMDERCIYSPLGTAEGCFPEGDGKENKLEKIKWKREMGIDI